MQISNDSLKAFKIIYCEYKKRRKSGFTKSDSIEFPDGSIELLDAFSSWLRPDIESAIAELVEKKLLWENVLGDNRITDQGLIFMESKPKEFFEDVSKLFDIASIFI